MESECIPRSGTTAHFDWLNRQMKDYWHADAAYIARSLNSMGVLNATTALNRLGKEKRATPPMLAEITALEATFWDNWAHTGGRRPKEKEANHDRQRFKLEIEVWNVSAPEPIFGGGNKAPNSIYKGSAITMDQAALAKYLDDKRDPKKGGKPWKDDEALSQFADDLDALAEENPTALIGPLDRVPPSGVASA